MTYRQLQEFCEWMDSCEGCRYTNECDLYYKRYHVNPLRDSVLNPEHGTDETIQINAMGEII